MAYDNSIILFNNKFHKEGNNLPSFNGFITCEGVKHPAALWEKKGDKGVYHSGNSYADEAKTEKNGDITVFLNHSNADKVPYLKGYYKIGEVEYMASLWKKTSKNGNTFFAGTIKIKDPEMKHKEASRGKIEKELEPDGDLPF